MLRVVPLLYRAVCYYCVVFGPCGTDGELLRVLPYTPLEPHTLLAVRPPSMLACCWLPGLPGFAERALLHASPVSWCV
jgi:hypothetical protein